MAKRKYERQRDVQLAKASDLGTPERRAKGDLKVQWANGHQLQMVARHVDPLEYYLNRKVGGKPMITQAQYVAGMKYRRLWRKGTVLPRYSQFAYCETIGDPEFNAVESMAEEEARTLYLRATAALRDLNIKRIILAVCCYEEFIKDALADYGNVAKNRSAKNKVGKKKIGDRKAMRLLKEGLEILSTFFLQLTNRVDNPGRSIV